MNTPVADFVRSYAQSHTLRMHMPGHKGRGGMGVEGMDVTEFTGADELYCPEGILLESQQNAARLFGAEQTVYSAEGSSLCIRAMLYLACLWAKSQSRPNRILAGRNAHRVFVSAAALLDMEVDWLWPDETASIVSCPILPEQLDRRLREGALPCAVYITSPDYLGNVSDIAGLARVCRSHGVPLLVDNAHGAYLRFLPQDTHPMTLGADLCCDSGHKTLPVLTGGAYLHISHRAPALFGQLARPAMALFASTSPSYLILQSLDGANARLDDDYPRQLAACAEQLDAVRTRLSRAGFALVGDETLKLTLAPRTWGYTGLELARYLEEQGIMPEYADPDHVVLMPGPDNGPEALMQVERALLALPRRAALAMPKLPVCRPKRACSPRRALFMPGRVLSVTECLGKVLADPMVSCPPAVPVAVSGEVLDETAIGLMTYYGTHTCRVFDPEECSK
ncbi:MAG: amino acid decarboxylase [Oscillospiraceae bacterium]|nr:amino acid decarboxylase [Oscillospiraceae bacterium]